MKFPDFIVAGCMKAGTTSMFMNLSKHPEITMSGMFGPLSPNQTKGTGTEIHYWSDKRKKFDINWYKRKFDGKVSGEKSPSYWNHMGALKRIYKHKPDTKIIVCLRHPVERAHSHYMMNRGKMGVSEDFHPKNVKPIHINLGKYHKHLTSILYEVIPKENIHIVISDRMKTNTTEEMMKVHKFLGVEEIDIPTKEIKWSKGIVSLYEVSQDKDHYIIWSAYSRRYNILPKVRDHYLKFYKPHNEKLFEFLGYRIPEWEK